MKEHAFGFVRHGRFTLAVPDGWADDSTIAFTGPVMRGLEAKVARGSQSTYQCSVNVTVELRPEGVDDPLGLLELIGNNLRAAGVELEDIVAPTPFTLADLPGAIVERRAIVNGETIRQVMAASFEGANLIIATANTAESAAKTDVPVLIDILRRIQLQRAP